jgi:hypothetical protein
MSWTGQLAYTGAGVHPILSDNLYFSPSPISWWQLWDVPSSLKGHGFSRAAQSVRSGLQALRRLRGRKRVVQVAAHLNVCPFKAVQHRIALKQKELRND